MTNFDDYFAGKLREEYDFPHRDQNWRLLQKRLEDSRFPLHFHQNIRFWKVAATLALLISSGLAWALFSGRQDNATLRRQIALLKSSKPATPPIAAILPDNTYGSPASQGVLSQAADVNAGEHHPVFHLTQTVQQQANVAETPRVPFDSLHAPVQTEPGKTVVSSDSPDIAPHDSIQALVQTARTDSVALTTSPGKDTVTAATAGAPVIRPVHPLSRLRVGIQGSVGFPLPREKGVSLMTGQGFRAEFALYKNIWLSASVDWLNFDVCTDKFVPRVHHPHHQPDTLHGSPDSKLVRVESTQRRQQIGLGLRYTLPLRTWLKPSVRAAYTWVHGSPETIRFEFKKPMKNDPPEYLVRKNDGGQLGDLLKIGVGLEYLTHDWVFGLWADYSKNIAKSDAGFDALTLQAGLLYRFN